MLLSCCVFSELLNMSSIGCLVLRLKCVVVLVCDVVWLSVIIL